MKTIWRVLLAVLFGLAATNSYGYTLTNNTPAITIVPYGGSYTYSVTWLYYQGPRWSVDFDFIGPGFDLSYAGYPTNYTFTYTFTGVDSSDAGSYYIVTSLDNGEKVYPSATSVPVTLDISPAILTQPQDLFCFPGAFTTMGIAAGPSSARFQWFDAATENPINKATNSPAFAPSLANNGERVYCKILNAYGSVTSSSAVITVAQPPIITTQPINVATNYGSTVTFNAAATGTQPIYYQWFQNGIAIQGANLNYIILESVANQDVGTYQVAITNAVGWTNSAVATLAISPQDLSSSIIPGALRLQFFGSPEYPYILQATTNLTVPINWQSITTNITDAKGFWNFADTNTFFYPAKFYRAMVE
jgi:hypothetical protein